MLLDGFAQAQTLSAQVKSLYQDWQSKDVQLAKLQEFTAEANAQLQLLTYQTEEINQLDPQPDEIAALEREQKELAHAESILTRGQQIGALIGEGEADHASALLKLNLKRQPKLGRCLIPRLSRLMRLNVS